MLFLRSLVFNVLFYANLIFWLVVLVPFTLAPRRTFMRVVGGWSTTSLWLLRAIVGLKVEFRGRERIPPGGLIVAAKHQSFWETFALFQDIPDPVFILKRELTWIPFFGWYLLKARQVPVNRKAGSPALVDMNRRARREVERGRTVVIFPEGTRRAAGAPPAYKFGIAHLYASIGAPCLPVALNSGLYWPRRSFLRRPGTVVIEFLDPIPPGLPRETFFAELQARVEAASDRLYREGLAALGTPDRRVGASALVEAEPGPTAAAPDPKA